MRRFAHFIKLKLFHQRLDPNAPNDIRILVQPGVYRQVIRIRPGQRHILRNVPAQFPNQVGNLWFRGIEDRPARLQCAGVAGHTRQFLRCRVGPQWWTGPARVRLGQHNRRESLGLWGRLPALDWRVSSVRFGASLGGCHSGRCEKFFKKPI